MKQLKVNIVCDEKARTVAIAVDDGEFMVYHNDNPVIDRLLQYLDWPERYHTIIDVVNDKVKIGGN